jgi:hypothetical protein
MNTYIKKCLLIYISLALVLIGMAGVAYAVTATDANEYVTRSEYALSVSQLQAKLDEAESSLLGNINRYRTTDIKFVTFDTPNIQMTSGGSINAIKGYHNGGNLFPRNPNYDSWSYGYGLGSSMTDRLYGYRAYISIHRLWNGNYYITNDINYRNSTDTAASAVTWTGIYRYALPIENYPGWYLSVGIYGIASRRTQTFFSLVKLDPKVPMPSAAELTAMQSKELQVRFKKDLFVYLSANPKFPTTPVSNSGAINYYENNNISFLTSTYPSNISTTGTQTLYFKTWTDADTGDCLMTIRGMVPSSRATMTGSYPVRVYSQQSDNRGISYLIPSDNVEYLMAPIFYSTSWESGYSSSTQIPSVPDPRDIGTGLYDSKYYDVEIVDGINGIKYWHSYKRPWSGVKLSDKYTDITGFHYSLPIVY